MNRHGRLPLWLWLGGVGFGLYFTLGVIYFEPFSFPQKAGWWPFIPISLALMLVSTGLAFLLFHRKSASRSTQMYTMGAFSLGALALAGLLVWLIAGGMDIQGHTWHLLGQVYTVLLLVGLLPVLAVLILVADRFRPTIPSRPRPTLATGHPPSDEKHLPATETAMLKLEVGDTALEIPLADLILLEAADNYIKFYYLKDQQRKTKILRMQMKVAEASLASTPGFHRCHRSYLVNGQMVEAIHGTAQNYRLQVRHIEEPVPVSRSFDITTLRLPPKGSGN
jgi:LytTr DNA-binding domain